MIFSHSSAYDIHCQHGRNVPDYVLQRMVSYWYSCLCHSVIAVVYGCYINQQNVEEDAFLQGRGSVEDFVSVREHLKQSLMENLSNYFTDVSFLLFFFRMKA